MTQYRHIAALGSSFAAGPGIPPTADWRAGRSGSNYAALLARRLGAKLTDLTVSGATTANVLCGSQRALGTTFPPQITGVPSDSDFITITVGGNDLNYIGRLIRAAAIGWLARGPAASQIRRLASVPVVRESDIDAVTQGIAEIAGAARRAAPGARVVLVDYLTVIGEDTAAHRDLPLSGEQIEGFQAIAAKLRDAFAAAAQATGADLVRASDLSINHGLGSPEPWVVGLKPVLPLSFHPNKDGMEAVAAALSDLVCD